MARSSEHGQNSAALFQQERTAQRTFRLKWIIHSRLGAPASPHCCHGCCARCILLVDHSQCIESFLGFSLRLLFLLLFPSTLFLFGLSLTLAAIGFWHGLICPALRRRLRGGHPLSVCICICLASSSCRSLVSCRFRLCLASSSCRSLVSCRFRLCLASSSCRSLVSCRFRLCLASDTCRSLVSCRFRLCLASDTCQALRLAA